MSTGGPRECRVCDGSENTATKVGWSANIYQKLCLLSANTGGLKDK